jgi:hypothetical protein
MSSDFVLHHLKRSQAPTCWSELPEKIWLKVCQHLKVEDVNKLHLVNRKLHQIANLHVNPMLHFKGDSIKLNLESLVQSSRIFEELKFSDVSVDYLRCQEKFEYLEEFISFTGIHMERLVLNEVTVHPIIFHKLRNLLPNLKALELVKVKRPRASKEVIKWNLNSTKIERIKIIESPKFENMLESLGNLPIKELELELDPDETKREALEKCLKAQEKNLKRLTIQNWNLSFLVGLKDLRLEYFNFGSCYVSANASLQFLKHQVNLKYLNLKVLNYSAEILNLICELKNMESPKLSGHVSDGSGLNNLYKLGKLKKLVVDEGVSRNILEYLQFGVFNDLEELNAYFHGWFRRFQSSFIKRYLDWVLLGILPAF